MCLSNMADSITTPERVGCPECFMMGSIIKEGSDHHPQCDGEEVWCHDHCPVPVQYMDVCPVCQGSGFVSYAEMMALVLSNPLTSPLDKSEIIEGCITGAEEWLTRC